MYKSHSCNELRSSHSGQTVKLAGWVNRRRDHGGVFFIDLRDRDGLVQVVVDPSSNGEGLDLAEAARPEWVLQIEGIVQKRPEGMENPQLETGDIEVSATKVKVLNKAKTPPFPINEETEVDEQVRLKYRYLDLRTVRMRKNLENRYRMIKFIRDFLDEREFWEIETPILFKTTPEGARDYLVPSRLYAGEFYALPQSPQQLKQMLMVAGVERYFQIARCFRDEDQRGDRQPEFTQLDMEMSFVDREDVMGLIEEMFTSLVDEIFPEKAILARPWPRLTYKEAMERFGKDNPDLRFGMELQCINDLAEGCGFKVFEKTVANGGDVRGFNAKGCGGYSRKQVDELIEFVGRYGAKGLATIALKENGEQKSTFTKFLDEETVEEILSRFETEPGDLLVFVADKPSVVFESLGRLRVFLGERLGLRDPETLAFCWVVDFPFVNWDEEGKRWDPSHHLFTAPMPEDEHLLDTDPGKARGQQYDLVLNDYEIAGGSIRIHDRAMQEKVFKLIGLDVEVARERFGHMLEAFEYGTPPHGGIAPGIDRFCMLLSGEPNIREVIPFPKNQAARDVMADAPSEVEEQQLVDLHLNVVKSDEEV